MTEPRRTFTAHLRVRFGETDAMGVANNAAYLQYFEIGRIEFLRAAGHSYAEVHNGGIDMVVAEAGIRYLRPPGSTTVRRRLQPPWTWARASFTFTTSRRAAAAGLWQPVSRARPRRPRQHAPGVPEWLTTSGL
jgi:hypothetical protein